MDFTNDFFIQAQGCIERTFRAKRPRLLKLHGNIKTEMKSDNTPVTALDKEFELDLKEALKKFDSSIGFEGEEFGIEGNRETYWLIDPIDGTENFIRGLPFVRNMAALVHNNEAVLAIIYCPISDELYVAAKGEGAFKNGKQIRVSNRPLKRAWLEVSSPLSNPKTHPVLAAVNQNINGFRTIGQFTYVAEGKLDGLLGYKTGGGAWDYAPRALLIQEAGAKVANIGSDRFDFRNNDFLMANPVIFDDLMKIITTAISE